MITDILTMIWKERKEQAGQQKDWCGKVVSSVFPLLMLGLMAVIPPMSVGPKWVESPFSLSASIIVPLMVVALAIPFSIAGERERKTLETLLASRLPDQAILFGKICLPIMKALGITLVVHFVSLTTVNLAYWDGTVVFYTPTMILVNLALIILLSVLAASLGVLVSLRATTVQQALQNLLVALMAPIMIVLVTIILIGRVFPAALRESFEIWFREVILSADFFQVFLFIFISLVVIDLGLLVTTLVRFKRCRLYLD